MSQFREAHKEDESEKKNSKMPHKRKKKAEHDKVWLFHKLLKNRLDIQVNIQYQHINSNNITLS